MASNRYRQLILETLEGKTGELRTLPRARLDWAGPGGLLDLFRKTAGNDRNALISAIGEIVEKQLASPAILSQLIQIASSLDLAAIEPQVRKLQREPLAAHEPLRSAVANFLAFRDLGSQPATTNRGRPRKASVSIRANGRKRTA